MGEMPLYNTPVVCTLRSLTTGKEVTELMVHVQEDDVTWRTSDDLTELNEMNWSVISWTYPAPTGDVRRWTVC